MKYCYNYMKQLIAPIYTNKKIITKELWYPHLLYHEALKICYRNIPWKQALASEILLQLALNL